MPSLSVAAAVTVTVNLLCATSEVISAGGLFEVIGHCSRINGETVESGIDQVSSEPLPEVVPPVSARTWRAIASLMAVTSSIL